MRGVIDLMLAGCVGMELIESEAERLAEPLCPAAGSVADAVAFAAAPRPLPMEARVPRGAKQSAVSPIVEKLSNLIYNSHLW